MYGRVDFRRIGEYIGQIIEGFKPFNLAELYPGPKIEFEPKNNLTSRQKDREAIASDFKKVGKDLESVLPDEEPIFNKRRRL